MVRFEVTKTVEAVKLNKRTMRMLTDERHTVPYGSIVTEVTKERGNVRFIWLGEPYEASEDAIGSALRVIEEIK